MDVVWAAEQVWRPEVRQHPNRGARGKAQDSLRGGRGSDRRRLDGVSPILLCFNGLCLDYWVGKKSCPLECLRDGLSEAHSTALWYR